MPTVMARDLFEQFDAQQKSTLELLIGSHLSDEKWNEAQLPLRLGGCGVRGAVSSADAAYVMSRAMTRESCKGMDRIEGLL